MAEITPAALNSRLESDDDLLVLDIRHEDDYREWHVPGSENVDVYDELQEDPKAASDALSELPADAEVVTVCAAGVLSDVATDRLREMGYDAKTLVDGMAGWSRVHRSATVEADVEGTLVQVARPGTGCLSHVLVADGEALVFDPSQYVEEYDAILDEQGADLVGVVDTHAHADHVSGGRGLAERHGVPYYIHPADAEAVDAAPLTDGQTLAAGPVVVEVVHTPGHSPGSVSFAVEDEVLLTGDTLFHESVGRVELGVEAGLEDADVEDNAATLYRSLQRLLAYDDETLVLPAHDPGAPDPPVTARLREVRERNDDLGRSREAFVAALASDVPERPPNFRRVKRVNAGTADADAGELAELELGPNRCAAE